MIDRTIEAVRRLTRHSASASLVVASLILLVTGLACIGALASEQGRGAERDRAAAADVAAEIESLFSATVGGLRGMRGFVEASPDLDAGQFSRISTALLEEHRLSGVQWIEWVDPQGRTEFEARTDLSIRHALPPSVPAGAPPPPGPAGAPPPGPPPAAFLADPSATSAAVITHAAPAKLHSAALGLDRLSDPNSRFALFHSIDTGEPMLSPPLPLAMPGGPDGLFLFMPVFDGEMPPKTAAARRGAIRGFVVGVYELSRLADELSERVPSDVAYRIDDRGRPYFASEEPPIEGATEQIGIAGALIGIEAESAGPTGWSTAAAILLIGSLVTLLSSVILRESRRRELAALEMAAAQRDRAAAEEALRENERHYRDMLENAPDGVIAIDDEGFIASANPAAHRIFGPSRPTLVGLHLSGLVSGPGVMADPAGVSRDALGTGDLMGLRRDGSEFPIQATIGADSTPARDTYTVMLRDVSGERRAAAEEQALRAVATAVASETAPTDIFDLVARRVAELEGADSACVSRMGARDGRIVGSWGGAAVIDARGRCAVGRAWRIGDPVIVFDHAIETDNGNEYVRATGIRSEIAVPVRVGGRLWGVLCLRSAEPYAFRSSAEGRLERFTELIGMAIANADARDQLTAMASTDALTGIPNQRAFNARLVEEVEKAARESQELALAVFDVDHFKKVNDTLGHQVGDAVLVEIASRLRTIVPEGDMLARVGGEEFAWIMAGVDLPSAVEAAERARAAIGGSEIAGVGQITISAGVAPLADDVPAGEIFRHADLALYLAKSRGRDLCVPYSASEVEGLPGRGADAAAERARRLASIRVLARAVDAKGGATPRHSERVSRIAEALGRELGWTEDALEMLREAALVHDVGKIGVPEGILTQAGALAPEEFRQVMVHAELGGRIVEGALSREQASWVRCHHERFDGGGYPDGLVGTEIPMGARIISVADAWDAMTHGRFYRPARPFDEAARELRRESGRQFCPGVVDALVSLLESDRLPHRPLAELLEPGESGKDSAVVELPDDVAQFGHDQLLEPEANRTS